MWNSFSFGWFVYPASIPPPAFCLVGDWNQFLPDPVVQLLERSLPSMDQVQFGVPLGCAWSASCLALAGWLKRRRGWPTGYSRKVFHLLTFVAVGVAHATAGLPAVCILGATTTTILGYAIWRGPGHPCFEALARESDGERQTALICTSYLATLIGGLVSNGLVGDSALVGYLVCGLGDAAGEPAGTRWGRHWYAIRVFSLESSRRSLEGSAAVFGGSLLAIGLALAGLHLPTTRIAQGVVIAAASTLVEAISPRGWDNATLQIVPSILASALLRQN